MDGGRKTARKNTPENTRKFEKKRLFPLTLAGMFVIFGLKK